MLPMAESGVSGSRMTHLSDQRPQMRIPMPFRPAFELIARLSDEDFASVMTSTSAEHATLQVEALAASIKVDLESFDVAGIVHALMSLTSLRRVNRLSVEVSSQAISNSSDLDLDDPERSLLEDRLSDLTEQPAVRLLGKAVDVATEHDQVFLGVRAFTDLRPVFGDEIDGMPGGAVLSHTLKFEFSHDEGQVGNFYITLDDEDLKLLKRAIERAEAKAEAMQELLGSIGMTYLAPEES